MNDFRPNSAYWEVKGYKGQQLLSHTRHTSKASKDVEVSAWRSRIRKGEASHAEVLSFGKAETIYD